MAGIEQWFQFESKDDKEANRKKVFSENVSLWGRTENSR